MEDAARVTREAAEAFARCDARVHLAEALAYLRIAVENRTATPELVSYVRAYVETRALERPFAPPN